MDKRTDTCRYSFNAYEWAPGVSRSDSSFQHDNTYSNEPFSDATTTTPAPAPTRSPLTPTVILPLYRRPPSVPATALPPCQLPATTTKFTDVHIIRKLTSARSSAGKLWREANFGQSMRPIMWRIFMFGAIFRCSSRSKTALNAPITSASP